MTEIQTENHLKSKEDNLTNKKISSGIWISLFILGLVSTAALSYTYYSISYDRYLLRKGEEKKTVLELVSAFVSTYSGHRAGHSGEHKNPVIISALPVPATFRAAALESFNKKRTEGHNVVVQMVGVPGLAIKTKPLDEQMATIVQSMSDQGGTSIWSDFIGLSGHEVLRTIKPVIAGKKSCVSCHNKLQAPKKIWKLGDIMGAYVIDVPASAFFKSLRQETGLLAAAVMLFGMGGGIVLIMQQNRFSSVQARVQRESERGVMLSEAREKAQDEARSLSSQLLETNQNLETALAKEKDLNELQRQFVSMASHEFRTPLAIIDGLAQRMKSHADKNKLTPEDAIQRVDKIRTAVKRMTRLMESTLSAARMEEGKIEVVIEPCNIEKIVREVCAHQQEIVPTHIISTYLAGLPETILADASSVEQMLANLLSNAVKYAPNAPEIAVVALRMGSCVVIAVCDRGLGIDADELDNIGDQYFRGKTSTGIAGTGIGLALTKVLIDMHGGSLNIESKKGEGSTFTISLPIAGPDLSQQADANVA